MSRKIPELEYQIKQYQKLDSVWHHSDSVRSVQNSKLQDNLTKEKKKSKSITRYSIITTILLICSLLVR